MSDRKWSKLRPLRFARHIKRFLRRGGANREDENDHCNGQAARPPTPRSTQCVQLVAVVHLLEVMTDPVVGAIANAPVDEGPLTAEEIQALDKSREWLKHNQGIPHEQVLAEFGIVACHRGRAR
jgi:hypothetical protein